MKIYDLIIIGSGPAGLTAGIYSSTYQLETLIIGKIPGGMISQAIEICNFPTYEKISGFELAKKMISQVKNLGIEIIFQEVLDIKKDKIFKITTNKKEYFSKKIIIATGRKRKELNVKGEKEFFAKGVHYCAICDAPFYKNKIVCVVGGGNSALTSALLLSKYAKKIYLIHRGEKFNKADPIWIKSIKKNKKIKIIYKTNIIEIFGKEKVKGIKTNNQKNVFVDGVFIEIGSIPEDGFLKKLKLKSKEKYICVDKRQETNIKGLFAAGDITNNLLKQAITSCAEGAIATNSVFQDLKKD